MANSENTRQKQHPKDDEIDLRQIWDVLSFNKLRLTHEVQYQMRGEKKT